MNLAAFAPWAAGFLFVFMFILVITEKFERHVVTLACGAAVLVIVFGICMHSKHFYFGFLVFGNREC